MSDKQPSEKISRRSFMNIVLAFTGTVVGGVLGIPLIGYSLGPVIEEAKEEEGDVWVPVGPLENYPIDKPSIFNFTRTKKHGWEETTESYGIYIVRKSDTDVEVFSNNCTHLGCRVNWQKDVQEYVCPCHDAHYAEDGTVISGPAPRPLDRFETKVEQGMLYIHLMEKE